MKLFFCVVLCSLVFEHGHNYRILGLFPLQSHSHMVMFEKLMKGLAEKGHEVDVVSHFPLKKSVPRYRDLSIHGILPTIVNNISITQVLDTMGNYFDIAYFMMVNGGVDCCKAVLNSAVAQELKESKGKYDLIITELFGSDCMLGFAYHLGVPVVSVTTSVNLPWASDRIGNPDNPSYIPNYLVPYQTRMTLNERIINTLILLGSKLGYDVISTRSSNAIAREFFGPNLPDLRDLIHNTSLILVNSHFSINQARPTVPNFIEVAGLHIGSPKPLSEHLQNSLNTSPKYKGVIYLSTGSMVLTETFPTDKLKSLFEAFRELPYKVMWKASKEKFSKELDIPNNIQFESWMPQLDILCHPKVKLFITHGGLMGTQEAIFCGVPRLGIPLFADQRLNLKTSEAMGLALIVEYDNITKESILETATELLENPRYRNCAKRASQLFKDRPMSALETAIYWIEYVIRYDGAPHLRSYGADLPWYQYYLIDVTLILGSALTILVISVYYLIFILLFKNKPSQKLKKN